MRSFQTSSIVMNDKNDAKFRTAFDNMVNVGDKVPLEEIEKEEDVFRVDSRSFRKTMDLRMYRIHMDHMKKVFT